MAELFSHLIVQVLVTLILALVGAFLTAALAALSTFLQARARKADTEAGAVFWRQLEGALVTLAQGVERMAREEAIDFVTDNNKRRILYERAQEYLEVAVQRTGVTRAPNPAQLEAMVEAALLAAERSLGPRKLHPSPRTN